jgi:hypothetical protein
MKKEISFKHGTLSLLTAGLFFICQIVSMANFSVSSIAHGQNVDAANVTVTVGQDASKASSSYFYYNPTGSNAQVAINNAITAAAVGATASEHGVVMIENATKAYELNSHILAKSNVDIIGASRDGVILKIAKGLTPVAYSGPGTTGWGGKDNAASCGAIINVWSGITNVNIKNITLDGSADDYYASRGRGHQEFPLMNIYKASNVVIDSVKFTKGQDNGMWATSSTGLEVKNSVFDTVGSDFIDGWNVSELKFHDNVGAIRVNTGVRFGGSGSGCYIYNNEFYTGTGGGSAIELETAVKNVKVYNNYFHDITPVSYGAIGYAGQSPTGTGHEYYNNLFVNMPYAINYVPASAVSHNNIMINCKTTVGKGTDTNNIKTETGYVFGKNGTNKAGNTYWTVSSGPLAAAFAGIKVGINKDVATGPQYKLTVVGGTGSGSYTSSQTVAIKANAAPTGKEFDMWTGDNGYLGSKTAAETNVSMPGKDIALTATYKDAPATTGALNVALVTKDISVKPGDKGVVLQDMTLKNDASAINAAMINIKSFDVKSSKVAANFDNVYLYQDDKQIAKGTISNTQLVFNKVVSVAAKGSSTLSLRADVSATATEKSLIFAMNYDSSGSSGGIVWHNAVKVTGSSSTVSISVPAKVTTLAASVVPNEKTSVTKGTTGVQLIAAKFTNTGSEDVKIYYMEISGDFRTNDVNNVAVYNGKSKVTATSSITSTKATFSGMSVPVKTGESVTLAIKGNIQSTTTKTSLSYTTESCCLAKAKGVSGAEAKVSVAAGNSTLTLGAVNTTSLSAVVVQNTVTSVAKDGTNVQLISVNFTNNTAEDVKIVKNGTFVNSAVSFINLTYYVDGAKKVASTNETNKTYSFDFTVVKGKTASMTLKGDVSSTAKNGAYSYTLGTASTAIAATGVTSAKAVTINYELHTQTLTITDSTTPPVVSVVKINKVYYAVDAAHMVGSCPYDNEWFELYNPTEVAVNVKGWKACDGIACNTISTTDLSIPAKGFMVVTSKATTWQKWTVPAGVVKVVLGKEIGSNGLYNVYDMLQLRDASNTVLDQLNWGAPQSKTVWPNEDAAKIWNPGFKVPNFTGMTLRRMTTGRDTDSVTDWTADALAEIGK